MKGRLRQKYIAVAYSSLRVMEVEQIVPDKLALLVPTNRSMA